MWAERFNSTISEMTEFISCPVTSADLAQIDALLSRTGQTRDDWLQALVQAALSETPGNIRNLTERVASLERTTAGLMPLEQQVKDLNGKIAKLLQPESLTANSTVANSTATNSPTAIVESPPSTAATASRPTSSSVIQSVYDVEEDEPDEILYEFLEPDPSSAPSLSNLPSGSIYDAEDEPDEILYDFLDDSERQSF